MEEGVFLGWLKQDGDVVREGEALYTLESDKSAQEVEATESGVLRISPHAPAAGGKVRVGELLGYIAEEDESVVFTSQESGIRSQKAHRWRLVPGTWLLLLLRGRSSIGRALPLQGRG